MKKLTLSNQELGTAFDSLKLSNAEMEHFVGGCFCSTYCFITPCSGSSRYF